MPTTRVSRLLDEGGAHYTVIPHPAAYTAQEEAEAAHVPGREWAKTVVFFADADPAIAVLPATHQIALDRLSEAAGAERLRMATESDLKDLFPECEVGAMPPFGTLWHMPTYVDRSLELAGRIVFHAGSHREAVSLPFDEFRRLANPVIADFAQAGDKPIVA